MSTLSLIDKIRDVYNRGGNVIEFLRGGRADPNDWQSIMISYDFQAGSYTQLASENAEYIERYTDGLATVLEELEGYESIMEVGVGEATVMAPLMQKVDPENRLSKFGFDVSWSRTRFARRNIRELGEIQIFMANLFDIPLADNSIDIVYTSHSLEPNGDREKDALRELFRVARKYVVLLEPDYESASPEGKARMERHGYVRNLPGHAKSLGYDVMLSKPFGVSINPLNPTRLTVIRKSSSTQVGPAGYVCPVTKSPLGRYDNVYFSAESGLIYPIIDGIPCLIESAAVVGLHFGAFNKNP